MKVDVENNDFSFLSIILKIDGQEYGVKGIDYSDSVERAKREANHPIPLGMTKGIYSAEASGELYQTDFKELSDRFKEKFYEKAFSVIVQYAEDGVDTITDELVGCRFKKREASRSRGADSNTVSFELDLLYIKWNGVDPFSKMPGR